MGQPLRTLPDAIDFVRNEGRNILLKIVELM
jgi:hypothetical protein